MRGSATYSKPSEGPTDTAHGSDCSAMSWSSLKAQCLPVRHSCPAGHCCCPGDASLSEALLLVDSCDALSSDSSSTWSRAASVSVSVAMSTVPDSVSESEHDSMCVCPWAH